jgi:two-component system, chemotaxis family, protein-glutamate methylesterase/glutaminase
MSTDARIRVLVIDDSAVVRKVVSDALNSDPGIVVVGTAADGKLGLAAITTLEPDLITLDIEMPVMDGLTMLSELRKTHRRLPVIMVSTLTGRGAAATLDALGRGASDYVTKPSSATNTSASSAIEHFRRELLPRVKGLCVMRQSVASKTSADGTPTRPATSNVAGSTGAAYTLRPCRPGGFELLAIGSSTGGPNAVEQVLAGLSADFPAPILLTQHMPPVFTKMLADRLAQKTRLNAVEAEDGMTLVPGTVYVAPGDFHLVVRRQGVGYVLGTNQAPPENSCRPAVDVMFRSVAETHGARTLAVVMTGMGYDGRVGAGAIAKAGGEIIVQDQATSVVWGMPGAVAEASLASEIVALEGLAAAIEKRFGRRTARANPTPPTTSLRRSLPARLTTLPNAPRPAIAGRPAAPARLPAAAAARVPTPLTAAELARRRLAPRPAIPTGTATPPKAMPLATTRPVDARAGVPHRGDLR